MNRTTTPSNVGHSSLGRAVRIGAVAGVIASLVMAMYAMIAAYAKDTGFFTPLYHIASLVTNDANMMKSMQADQMNGDAFTFLLRARRPRRDDPHDDRRDVRRRLRRDRLRLRLRGWPRWPASGWSTASSSSR